VELNASRSGDHIHHLTRVLSVLRAVLLVCTLILKGIPASERLVDVCTHRHCATIELVADLALLGALMELSYCARKVFGRALVGAALGAKLYRQPLELG